MEKKKEEKIILEAWEREEKGTRGVKRLRSSAFIPAVVYGHGKKTQALKVKSGQLSKHLQEHGKENVIIDLQMMRDSKSSASKHVLVKNIQYDPLKGNPIHIDFYEVSLTETINVRVPLAAKGEAIGVKQDGGMLEHHLWELNIACLATDIPKQIEYDITNLKLGDVVHIKDLNIPSNLKVLHTPETIVFSIVMPKKEKLPEEAVVAAPIEPEVIKEKKPEEAKEGKEQKEEKEEKKPKEEKK